MLNKYELQHAIKDIKKGLRLIGLPVNRESIMDCLVLYYGCTARDIENLKFKSIVQHGIVDILTNACYTFIYY